MKPLHPLSTKWCSYVVTRAREGQSGALREAMEKDAEAHRSIEGGSAYLTYTDSAGEDFFLFLPFTRFGEIDEWRTNRELVVERFGEEKASENVEQTNAAVLEKRHTIMRFAEEVSLVKTMRAAGGGTLQQLNVRLDAANASKMAIAMETMMRVHAEHPEGLEFFVHAPFIGEAIEIKLYSFPTDGGDAFLDANRRILEDALGLEEAAAVLADFEAGMARCYSRTLRLEPTLSSATPPEVDAG